MREFDGLTWAEAARNKTIQDVIDGDKKLDEKISNLEEMILGKKEAELFATMGTYPDNVNSPKHYNQGGVECIDAITAATTDKTGIEAVCTANIIKYLWRYEAKNGLEDVKKAQWYLNKLIERLENDV